MLGRFEDYQGRILRVNLSSGEVKPEKVDAATVRQCLGGAALGAKLLYDEVAPDVDWDDPGNRFIIASGPLGGTMVPGSGTFSVISKGPMTNGAAVTQANGFFGAYLRHNGFDAILVQGRAPKLSYIYVNDGTAEIRDAAALSGKDTWETGDIIREQLKGERPVSVVSVGPAGENRVRFAGVFADHGHSASHNGVGAVMGAKNLKAIAVSQGGVGIPIKDGRRLLSLVEGVSADVRSSDGGQGTYRWGTLNGVFRGTGSVAGTLPVKNYSTSIYSIEKEALGKFAAPYIREHFQPSRSPCFSCFMHHAHTLRVPDGPYRGKLVDEPEYEGLAACGPVIGQTDATWAIVLSDLADRLGMDVNETGWVIGMVMECYEKGILGPKDTGGLEMTWGNAEATYALLHHIAHRQGLGDVLAEGVMRAAQKIGGDAPNLAIHTIKGNSPRGHDHRANWSEIFDTATSNTGTLESGGRLIVNAVIELLGLPKHEHFSPEGVAEDAAAGKGAMLFEDSLGICRFLMRTDLKMLTNLLEAATGWQISPQEALTIGRRAANRLRVFNLRHGIPPELDRPSPRYGSVVSDGPMKGKNVMPHWEDMLRVYYRKMGWDQQGRPLPETLQSLGLADLVPHIWPG